MRPKIFDMLFHDDRMFVLEISPVTTRTVTEPSQERQEWGAITRRNVPGYPPFRSDTFNTEEEALFFYKRTVVSTPRVSLGNQSPNPPPTLQQYTDWLIHSDTWDPVLNPNATRK
jgi:hypothetical protein